MFGDVLHVINVVFFKKKFYSFFVPEIHASAVIRIIQFFGDQKYPNITKTVLNNTN